MTVICMQKNKMCEIDGKRYVIPSVFGDGIGWNCSKVTAACKDGRIVGACKDTSGKWIIPTDTVKPLETDQIRSLMITTVYLKNKPNHVLDYSEHDSIVAVYSYLQQTGYIEPFNSSSERITYEVVMTEKGLKLATEGKQLSLNWLSIGTTVIQVAASILTIAQALGA
jgi:hypothetical protein